MKWASLLCLLWMTITPAYADSDTVDSEVWERMIRRCDNGLGSGLFYYNNLSDDFFDGIPEGAMRVMRRARRCQDRVRRQVRRAARQCIDDWREKTHLPENDRHRIATSAVYNRCRDQYDALLERFLDCCAVIPGY